MSIVTWSEDSILSRAGYCADGSLSEVRRRASINRAIGGSVENALEVIEHLRWLIEDRGCRFPRAERIWREDLGYVARMINAEGV